jgi:4-hydroxybenzoate polyprenyltransferase
MKKLYGLVINLIISMRPAQWIKNLIIFAGIVFSKELFIPHSLIRVSLTFLVFCLLVGGNYIINDIRDIENDKLHPKKRLRPIPSGKLPIGIALCFGSFGLILSIICSFYLSYSVGIIALMYILLMLAYTSFLKEIPIVDAFIIAIGFVLRAIAGVEVIQVSLSPWFFICSILIALFIVFCKRRHELTLLETGAVQHRKILAEYNPILLDQMISVVTASTVVTYTLYTMWPDTVAKFNTYYLVYTVPFVMYGIFRYLYLVYKKDVVGSPEKALLTDFPMMISMGLWFVSIICIIYFMKG